MIDIHFHCLPAIDDGPPTWTEAVALCRAAAAEGTHTIVATPHVLREGWLNTDAEKRHDLLAELNRLLGGKPVVLPGCELYFCADAVELWQLGSRGPLTTLNRTRYVLVEFPSNKVPKEAESVIHEFVIAGVRPVIAHPERNLVLRANVNKMRRMVQLGALMQVTAASVIGTLGAEIQKFCDELFAEDLIHFIASDAHSIQHRPPALRPARERVRRDWGRKAESRLFELNPRAVVANAELPSP